MSRIAVHSKTVLSINIHPFLRDLHIAVELPLAVLCAVVFALECTHALQALAGGSFAG